MHHVEDHWKGTGSWLYASMNLCTCEQKFDHNHSKLIGDCKSLAAYMEMKILTISYWHQTRCILKRVNGRIGSSVHCKNSWLEWPCPDFDLFSYWDHPCWSSCSWVVKMVQESLQCTCQSALLSHSRCMFDCCQRYWHCWLNFKSLLPCSHQTLQFSMEDYLPDPAASLELFVTHIPSPVDWLLFWWICLDNPTNEIFFQVSNTTTMFILFCLCSMMCHPPSLHHIGGFLLCVIYAHHMHSTNCTSSCIIIIIMHGHCLAKHF